MKCVQRGPETNCVATMGCCASQYRTVSTSADIESARLMHGLTHLKTGDLVWFLNSAAKSKSSDTFSHVGVVVSLPTLFSNEPLLLLEYSVECEDDLVNKLTNQMSPREGVRLVNLADRLRCSDKPLFQLICKTDMGAESDRRLLSVQGVSGSFSESEVLGHVHACAAEHSSGSSPLALAVAFLQRLGIYQGVQTKRKRLTMQHVAEGCLMQQLNHEWRLGSHLQEYHKG